MYTHTHIYIFIYELYEKRIGERLKLTKLWQRSQADSVPPLMFAERKDSWDLTTDSNWHAKIFQVQKAEHDVCLLVRVSWGSTQFNKPSSSGRGRLPKCQAGNFVTCRSHLTHVPWLVKPSMLTSYGTFGIDRDTRQNPRWTVWFCPWHSDWCPVIGPLTRWMWGTYRTSSIEICKHKYG